MTESERVGKLVEALQAIADKRGMTLLHDCCVNNTCREIPGESNCTHQLGVNRGFGECASIADAAIVAWLGGKE